MKKRKARILISAAVLVVFTFSIAMLANAATAGETSVSSVSLGALVLSQNSSYVSGDYFGIMKVSSDNTAVAAASADSLGRVVITAVGAGTTDVHYWFRTSESGGWTSATVPVTVPGTAAQNSEDGVGGLAFAGSSVSLPKGSGYTVTDITLNGKKVEASSLLWVSSSSAVAKVEADTGKITAVASGTTVVYAIDPRDKSRRCGKRDGAVDGNGVYPRGQCG